MTLPSDAFLQALAALQDVQAFTGVLSIHCHEGRALRVDVQHAKPLRIYVLKARQVDLQTRSGVETLESTMT